MNVTVAICTWNRAKLLDQTLTQMRNLRIPEGVSWELLVVNNNCTDDTDAVIARHAGALPIRRLLETKQGHSHARNCAVEHARGDLLIWTDDDVLAPSEWLAEYLCAAKQYPDAVYFGGPIRPWWETPPPRWARRNLRRVAMSWALLDHGSEVRPLQNSESVFGANMAFRMSVLTRYRFDPNCGRVRDDLMSGDEYSVIGRLRQEGGYGIWVGRAPVEHFVLADRVSVKYLRKFYRVHSYQVNTSLPEDNSPRLFGVPRWLLWKYWKTAAREKLWWITGGERWISALLEAARIEGIMDRIRGRVPPGAKHSAQSKG
jgi:glycosyltransferase involved in cell wall biosynthesis